MNERRVVCAAIRDVRGRIVLGPRHFDPTMHRQLEDMFSYTTPWEQGFVDQHGAFMDRREAWLVAQAAGQILRRVGGDTQGGGTLYSENLY